ncbi:multidrug transporter [Burkholderia ubonensis]|uniref:FUSC family protein n=1 Tax=Burkholderia ubonensis TaxID=101571 RepID=UPI000758FA48|nr:FUSC family protein [Burkholderia ubonensis]KWE50844.1 multidrug transporter [Burkholderia ubonensis]KWE75951.1 multidrug transporter [Burkholderia ubonensis]KWE76590.1 multidrug transporter [Burkholderia ubonensis]
MADDDLPAMLRDFAAFLARELAPFPGRLNVMLRCVLTSAMVIVASMALEVPELALSLLVVFYVTQSNVVITRLVGVMFIAGSTLAVGQSILLLKFTFDYPLLRVVVASLLFFGSVYLIRVLRIGVVFFIVAIVIIYVQSFVDRTDQADLLIRAVLWVWIAINYPIALTLVVNTLLLPGEPQAQLKAEIHRQLAAVDARLTQLIDGDKNTAPIPLDAVQQGAIALQKLLKFTTMRDADYRKHQAFQLACIATVSRLYRGARDLPSSWPDRSASHAMLFELRANCRSFDESVATGEPYRYVYTATREERDSVDRVPAAAELQRALHAFSDLGDSGAAPGEPAAGEPMVAVDAWTNPAYARFSLKTLLAVLVCYVFYNAVDWQGIHTIMLTCVIVALPSLGASMQRALLRVAGALVGSALALFTVVFVIPHLDDIVGLLLTSLPVVAFAAWISAGSERIGYAGTQLMFTFSLALLERFGPTTNLTEIRDRMVGILLGVGVATLVQISFWREGEGDALRQKLAAMLRAIAAQLSATQARDGMRDELPAAKRQLQAWAVLADCEATLSRVALEPAWREGEQSKLTLHAQSILAQGREIMLAGQALQNMFVAQAGAASRWMDHAARASLNQACAEIARYADDLAADPPVARTPQRIEIGISPKPLDPADMQIAAAAHELLRQVAGLPDWCVEAPVTAPSPEAVRP